MGGRLTLEAILSEFRQDKHKVSCNLTLLISTVYDLALYQVEPRLLSYKLLSAKC